MEICFINLRKSLEIQPSRIFQTYCLPFKKRRLQSRHYATDCMPIFNLIMMRAVMQVFPLHCFIIVLS